MVSVPNSKKKIRTLFSVLCEFLQSSGVVYSSLRETGKELDEDVFLNGVTRYATVITTKASQQTLEYVQYPGLTYINPKHLRVVPKYLNLGSVVRRKINISEYLRAISVSIS